MPLINVVHGDRIPTSAFNVRVPVYRPSWGLLVLWWAIKTLAKLLAFLVRYWWATAPLFAALYVWGRFGTVALAAVLATVTAGLVSWWRWHRTSFRRFAALPYVSRWRHVAIYRRRWHAVMAASGLAMSFDGDRYVPRLLKVRTTPIGDELTVQMLPGQMHEDWAKAAPRLAPTFRVRDGRARSGSKPDRVVLLRRTDPLTQIVAPFPVPMVPDLTGLPVGRREDDRVYRLKLAGTHVLVAGETGAGKGSVIWSIVSALAGGIAAGTVKVIGLDPKGGMELAPGARLLSEFAYGNAESMADVLEAVVAKMQARSGRLRGVTRQHTPTVDEPLYVVVIDEIAAMTSYGSDRKTKDRIKNALSMLLTQGRALGVHVIAALQDPRKEILPVRDLFPTRIALQLTEPEQVDLVLNEGALDRGARCHEITLPGVGYVIVAKQPWPVQVRFSHFDDAAIGDLATRYGRLRPVSGTKDDYEGGGVNITKTSGRMWAAAAEFATALRADLAEGITGIKWRRPPRECPPWCARGHHCTAQHGYPSGEHRTAPASWSTGYGSLVATRVAHITGATNRIEVRTVITLPGGEEAAGALASQLLTGIHLTITTLTTPAPDRAPLAAPRVVPVLAAGGRHALPGGTR